MKKHLIYSNTGLSSKQIGLTAEYLEVCKRNNVELQIVLCDNVLENCYFNPLHNSIACASCQSRIMELLKRIGIPKSAIISLKKYKTNFKIPFFNNLSELIEYNYEGINIGRGVASSVISYYRDYNISSDKYGDIINLEISKSVNVLNNFRKLIESQKPDKVVLFNGRFSEIYPLLDYCTKSKIDYTSIESGSLNSYELFENTLPHSISYRHERMVELWENEKNLKKRNEIAHAWFTKKRYRDDSISLSFTKDQKLNSLPKNFDANKINVILLNSSEDEMKVIEEFQTDIYNTQNEAITKIASNFMGNHDFHFYLRVHPNLGKIENVQMQEINEMNFENLTIIGPNEKIDTYALIDACDKSIVFGSTTGLEATYWGNVSILLGKSFYYYLENSCYKPKSLSELFDLIENTSLIPKPQDSCLPYGYYYSVYGVPTQFFKYDGLNNSTFKGKKIKKWYPSTLKYLFRYAFQLKKWKLAYKAATGNKLKFSDLFRYKI